MLDNIEKLHSQLQNHNIQELVFTNTDFVFVNSLGINFKENQFIIADKNAFETEAIFETDAINNAYKYQLSDWHKVTKLMFHETQVDKATLMSLIESLDNIHITSYYYRSNFYSFQSGNSILKGFNGISIGNKKHIGKMKNMYPVFEQVRENMFYFHYY